MKIREIIKNKDFYTLPNSWKFVKFVGDLKHFADYLIITYVELTLSSKIFLHFTILFLPLHRRKIDTIKLSTSLFHTEGAFLKYEQSLVRTY